MAPAIAAAAAALLLLLIGVWTVLAFGDGSTRVLTTTEAKRLLLRLPYRYTFRHVKLPEGATGALAGRMIGGHHTIVHFGIALGRDAMPVPVPHSGTLRSYGYSYGGFVYTDDILTPGKNPHTWVTSHQLHTEAQWDEATTMNVRIEEKLCRAATGEPCHEG